MRYVNPGHPAGELYPQEIGALKGAGGYAQSRDDTSVVVKVKGGGVEPISQRRQLSVGGSFGRSINSRRMVNDEGDTVRE